MTKPTLTPELLADLRRKAEAATGGLWTTLSANAPAFIVATTPYGTRIWTDSMGLAQRTHADDGVNATLIAAANPATVLALLDRIEVLEAALGDVSTTCETKELRHYSPDDPNLAVKQRKVIDTAWSIARRAYGGQS